MINELNSQEIDANQNFHEEPEYKKDIKDLYDFEINRFQSLIKENSEYAYTRYGLTMFYSIPPEETYNELNKLGFEANESIDAYNKGAIECQQGNIKEALEHFTSAESMGCDRPELFFNMALAYEEQEDNSKAKEYYNKYVEQVEKYDLIPKELQNELDEIREHIKTL